MFATAAVLSSTGLPDPLETAREWVSRLGGEGMAARSWIATPALAVGHFRFRPLEEEIEAPSLPFHYVSLTLKGSLKIAANVGGKAVDVRLRSGQSMIMAAHRHNRWRWDAPTEEAFVFLRPEFLRQVAEEIGVPDCDISDRFVFEDAHLRRTLLGIAAEISTPGEQSSLFLDMAAHAVAARLLARHRNGIRNSGQTSLTTPQLRRILAVVADRLSEDIDLASLADAAGISRFHFLRCFRATMGKSPHQWVTHLRVERAKTLLMQKRLSILEIAASVGFQSQSHFGQVFRRETGLPPKEWRSQRRNH